MINGNVTFNIVRDDKVVYEYTSSNKVNTHLYEDIQGALVSGTAMNFAVETMVAHFNVYPNLTLAQMVSANNPVGYKFKSTTLQKNVTDSQAVFTQNLVVPLNEGDVRFNLKGFSLGRNFQSVTSTSLSTVYSSYQTSTKASFGQVNRIYAYLPSVPETAVFNYTLQDGDQIQLTWALKIT